MNGGIGFSTITAGANPNIPALRFEYITTFQPYDFITHTMYGSARSHKECAFMTPRWCGDGILDTTHGEVCDDGAENGQPSKCNLTCTGTPPIVASCIA